MSRYDCHPDSEPWHMQPPEVEQIPSERFREELRSLINRHSLENGSNTPDFVLADYLLACLVTWNRSTNQRERFFFPKVEPAKKKAWRRWFTNSYGVPECVSRLSPDDRTLVNPAVHWCSLVEEFEYEDKP